MPPSCFPLLRAGQQVPSVKPLPGQVPEVTPHIGEHPQDRPRPGLRAFLNGSPFTVPGPACPHHPGCGRFPGRGTSGWAALHWRGPQGRTARQGGLQGPLGFASFQLCDLEPVPPPTSSMPRTDPPKEVGMGFRPTGWPAAWARGSLDMRVS